MLTPKRPARSHGPRPAHRSLGGGRCVGAAGQLAGARGRGLGPPNAAPARPGPPNIGEGHGGCCDESRASSPIRPDEDSGHGQEATSVGLGIFATQAARSPPCRMTSRPRLRQGR